MTARKKKTTKKAEQMELGGDRLEELTDDEEAVMVLPDEVVAVEGLDDDGNPVVQFGAPPDGASMLERLAIAGCDVETIEKIIAMQEREQAKQAEAAFNVALVGMQGDLPEVIKTGEVDYGTGNSRVTFKHAKMEDVQRALREPLAAHGFALMFTTEQPDAGGLTVTARLVHAGGHSESNTLHGPRDDSGSKNKIQGLASTESYLMRYTAVALLNLATTDMDNDGASSVDPPEPEPDGYEDWLKGADAVAGEQGTEGLRDYWKKADTAYRTYLTKYNLGGYHALVATAAATTKAGA